MTRTIKIPFEHNGSALEQALVYSITKLRDGLEDRTEKRIREKPLTFSGTHFNPEGKPVLYFRRSWRNGIFKLNYIARFINPEISKTGSVFSEVVPHNKNSRTLGPSDEIVCLDIDTPFEQLEPYTNHHIIETIVRMYVHTIPPTFLDYRYELSLGDWKEYSKYDLVGKDFQEEIDELIRIEEIFEGDNRKRSIGQKQVYKLTDKLAILLYKCAKEIPMLRRAED